MLAQRRTCSAKLLRTALFRVGAAAPHKRWSSTRLHAPFGINQSHSQKREEKRKRDKSTHSLTHLLTYSLTCSLICSLIPLCLAWLCHALAVWLTHSLAHLHPIWPWPIPRPACLQLLLSPSPKPRTPGIWLLAACQFRSHQLANQRRRQLGPQPHLVPAVLLLTRLSLLSPATRPDQNRTHPSPPNEDIRHLTIHSPLKPPHPLPQAKRSSTARRTDPAWAS